MKMRRLAKAFLGCTLVCTMLAGCGGQSGTQQNNKKDETNVKIGMLTRLNVSEEKLNDIMKRVDEEAPSSVRLAREIVYYDKLASMQMGLESDSIQAMSVYSSVANYLVERNNKLVMEEISKLNPAITQRPVDLICCAVRKEDENLKNELDKVIEDMKSDGTLERLTKEYITDLKKDEEPPSVPIQNIPGAESLKIAVTGDLPPLDLVRSDGTAAGFNTAVLSEIGKRLNRNIAIVQVDSAARSSALISGKVDVVFWAMVPMDDRFPSNMDQPEGMEVTVPYFQDGIVHVKKK